MTKNAESTVHKNQNKLLEIAHLNADAHLILVREEEANTPAFNKNGAKSVQQELDFLKSEVLNLWAHVKEKPQEEDLRSENSRLRETILSLKEENKKLVQERDSLNFALQIVSREAAAQCLPTNNTLMNALLSQTWTSQHLVPTNLKTPL